ncbi:MAG: tRNA epoxyqueuosine(34) reductase QueG [Gemmatimonadetes bacterium]|nr:tRNA epoxyqueuosine(34) reductase QueG [Gemmatimonadota bacterium]
MLTERRTDPDRYAAVPPDASPDKPLRDALPPESPSQRIRGWARELGFDAVGIAPAAPSAHADHYRGWIAAGNAGEMSYLAREDAIARRADPALVVPQVRSAVVVAMGYAPPGDDPERGDASSAIFARYARNDDYHDLLKPRLIALQERIAAELGGINGRAYVDTGPVLERELAARAGLGWFGKNTMLIQPRRGSYYFLGVILLDVELAYDEPFERDQCGSCKACLDQCPTGALLGRDAAGAPRMDARRCISYLTIELKGPIPRELRPLMGNRIYGCDICQEVCPHNNPKWVQISPEEAFWPRAGVHGAKLIELMSMDQAEFSRRFKNSPVKRAKRRGLLRNVAVALGNWRSEEAVPVLTVALNDGEPLIRGHAAWALGRIATRMAVQALRRRTRVEGDGWVQGEIDQALEEASSTRSSDNSTRLRSQALV